MNQYIYSKKVNIITGTISFAGLPIKYNEKITILAAGFRCDTDGVFAYVELDSDDNICAEEILHHIELEKGFHLKL